MEPILVENLIAVAIEDSQVLFVREEDKDNQEALGMLVNCDASMSWSFGLVQKYLKLWNMDILEDNTLLHEYYQDRIGKTFNGNAIYQMMTMFKEQIDKWSNLEDKFDFEITSIFKYNENK